MPHTRKSNQAEHEVYQEEEENYEPPELHNKDISFPVSTDDEDTILRGQKGERGSRGPPGESMVGLPGLPGAVGVVDGGLREEQMLRPRERGPPGPPGVCLCNISQIINSYNDLIEPSYRYSGSSYGSSDIDFIPGRKGERGEVGPMGPAGSPGPKGEQGDRGLPGPPGTPGPPGPMGGFSRDDSSTEVDSPLETRSWKLGVPGPKGDTGLPGEKGDKGESGTKGAKGDRGFVGMQGVKGEPGILGLDGLPGLPGVNGRPGNKGEKGDSGSPGPPGPPGTTAEMISVNEDGTVLSVARGEPGPKGDKGEKGSSGDRGEPGETGNAGIPGPRGLQGEEGPKGEPGSAGLVGSTGPQGPKGDRGPPGPSLVSDQGFDLLTIKGEKGEVGKRGRRGRPGPMGPPGLPAPTEVMMKGEKGERGRDGSPGPAGVPGLPAGSGVQYVPVPGPPGPPGPPGIPGGATPATGSQPFRPKFKDRSPFDRLSGHLGSLEELKALNELKQLKEERFHGPPPSSRRQYNDTKVVPGAVTFQTKAAMSSMSLVSPVGTLAYVIDEEALLVRVRNGWQYVALGSLVPVTTEAPPSSTPSDHHHPVPAFETSSLLNLPTHPEAHQLRMVALNDPFAGDLKGQADYQCYRQARRAGLKGDFRAFLSSRVQNINTLVRFSDRDLPIVNLKGDVLFNSWQDLFNGDGAYFPQPPRIYTFSGKNILSDLSWPNKYMWHGSLTTGERAMDLYCDAWDSDSKDRVGLASPLAQNKLLGQERFPCDQQLAVLCIETDSPPLRARRRRSRQRGND